MLIRKLCILAALTCSFSAVASDHPTSTPTTPNAHGGASKEAYPSPELSENPNWAYKLLVGAFAAFILAAGVGVVYKIAVPAEPEPAPDDGSHAHDASHGAHHH